MKFVGSLKNSTQKDLLNEPRPTSPRQFCLYSKKVAEYFRVQREVYDDVRTLYVVIDPAKERKQVLKFNAELAARQAKLEKFVSESLNVKKWRDPQAVATKLRNLIGTKNPWKSVLAFDILGEYGALAVNVTVDQAAKMAHEETLGRSILFTNQGGWPQRRSSGVTGSNTSLSTRSGR